MLMDVSFLSFRLPALDRPAGGLLPQGASSAIESAGETREYASIRRSIDGLKP
jgi:hypothetical protein